LDEHNKNTSFEWILAENGLGLLGVNAQLLLVWAYVAYVLLQTLIEINIILLESLSIFLS